MKKLCALVLVCMAFGSMDGQAFSLSKKTHDTLKLAKHKANQAYMYVNKTFEKFSKKHFPCISLLCGREGSKTGWEYSLHCALENKLHKKCWQKIIKEINHIDEGKVKKGHFFSGYESLPLPVRTFLKLLLKERMDDKKMDLKLYGDIILTFYKNLEKHSDSKILKAWKDSKKPMLGQIYSSDERKGALGQVIHTDEQHEDSLGALFVIHPDKARQKFETVYDQGGGPKYIVFSTIKQTDKAGNISRDNFGIEASHMVLKFSGLSI